MFNWCVVVRIGVFIGKLLCLFDGVKMMSGLEFMRIFVSLSCEVIIGGLL